MIVVLGGMKMFQNLGPEFTTAFEGAYGEAAAASTADAVFIPFFLNGVAGDPSLNLPDGIHPTVDGYAKVVDHIFPYVRRAVERHKQRG